MLNPIDSPAKIDSQSRPTVRAIPINATERTSGEDQQAVPPVTGAAFVELGTGSSSSAEFLAPTYKRSAASYSGSLPAVRTPTAADGSAAAEKITVYAGPPKGEAGALSVGATKVTPAAAGGASPDTAAASAGRYKVVRGVDGVEYAASGHVLVSPDSINADPETTIRELTKIRQAALTPPTTLTDLELAARASLDVQRAQLELARQRYTQEASDAGSQTAKVDSAKTDITA